MISKYINRISILVRFVFAHMHREIKLRDGIIGSRLVKQTQQSPVATTAL